jgi:hypothetical protein
LASFNSVSALIREGRSSPAHFHAATGSRACCGFRDYTHFARKFRPRTRLAVGQRTLLRDNPKGARRRH